MMGSSRMDECLTVARSVLSLPIAKGDGGLHHDSRDINLKHFVLGVRDKACSA